MITAAAAAAAVKRVTPITQPRPVRTYLYFLNSWVVPHLTLQLRINSSKILSNLTLSVEQRLFLNITPPN